MTTFFKRFRRDIVGVLWLSGSVFIFLSLLSFHPSDPSFNSTGASLNARNYCGYFGSFLADLLFQAFGATAWILVAGAVLRAVRIFRGQETSVLSIRLIGGVLMLGTSASLLSLYLPGTRLYSSQIPVGGLLGTLISKGLVSVFNQLGVSVILWSLTVLLLMFYTERLLRDLFKLPKGLVKSLQGALARSQVLDAISALFAPLPAEAAAGGRSPGGMRVSGQAEPKRRFKIKKEEPATARAKSRKEDEAGDEDEVEAAADDDSGGEGESHEENDGDAETGAAATVTAPLKSLFGFPDMPRRKVKLKAKVERRIEDWKLPDLNLLEDPPDSRIRIEDREIRRKADLLVDKLNQFSVKGEVVAAKPGPAVTLYEFKPKADVKISKITELADDLSLALSSESVRIIAPIPGRDVVGIETSNSARETVYLKDILAHDLFWSDKMKLPLALGREANGESKVVDLRKMPHLLVAGTTGSGKSVFVVSSVTGLLFKHSPKTLRLILIDPKQVDLAVFSNVPHLLMPPIREAKKAVTALKWAIKEMDKRYRSMSRFGARGIESFNEIVEALPKEEIERHEKTNEEWEGDVRKLEQYYFTPQPYIVIVVEEFGDLMAVDKVNVEQAVVRLAQMARACGIHLILAMQSPRKDVVTGLIKTNIPGRISFKVASKMDSRIILDDGGAERLLAQGDMLFLAPGVSKPQRHHGPWVTEAEISAIMQSWSSQGEPQFDLLAMRALEGSGGGFDFGGEEGGDGLDGDEANEYDERYDEILAWTSTMKEVSASLLQRKFKLGYPRAARMIEIFEREGVVGPANGSKPRQVLVNAYKNG